MSPGHEIDRAAAAAVVLDGWRDPSADDRVVVEELVADWAREADGTPDPEAVLAFQRQELAAVTASSDGDRSVGVRTVLLRRRVDRLAGEAVRAGRGARGYGADTRDRGRALLDQIESLARSLADSGVPDADALRRTLGDAMLDARYAMEGGGATSLNLAREAPAAPEEPADDPGPPAGLRP